MHTHTQTHRHTHNDTRTHKPQQRNSWRVWIITKSFFRRSYVHKAATGCDVSGRWWQSTLYCARSVRSSSGLRRLLHLTLQASIPNWRRWFYGRSKPLFWSKAASSWILWMCIDCSHTCQLPFSRRLSLSLAAEGEESARNWPFGLFTYTSRVFKCLAIELMLDVGHCRFSIAFLDYWTRSRL